MTNEELNSNDFWTKHREDICKRNEECKLKRELQRKKNIEKGQLNKTQIKDLFQERYKPKSHFLYNKFRHYCEQEVLFDQNKGVFDYSSEHFERKKMNELYKDYFLYIDHFNMSKQTYKSGSLYERTQFFQFRQDLLRTRKLLRIKNRIK